MLRNSCSDIIPQFTKCQVFCYKGNNVMKYYNDLMLICENVVILVIVDDRIN